MNEILKYVRFLFWRAVWKLMIVSTTYQKKNPFFLQKMKNILDEEVVQSVIVVISAFFSSIVICRNIEL